MTSTTVRKETPAPHTVTTTTTMTTQDIPVATLSDREDDRVPPGPAPQEEGGLFTRTGRTLDKTSHTVEHSVRKAGASVQRFFTGHSDLDQEDQHDH